MNTKLLSIIKFEFMRFFLSPIAYVYLFSFLLLSGAFAIYFGHFFYNGSADLFALFDYQPWVYLLFIPGICMRLWADEFKSKTATQILTLPVSLSDFVWGKFFASWLFCTLAILLTFPFVITVNIYGNPDNLVIFIGYLGCIALSGVMIAISQTMSAITKNSIIALALSVIVNLLFLWSSFDYVLFWARRLFSDVIVDTIISFSFLGHFFSFSRGLVELRSLVFFTSIIILFNWLTKIIIEIKTKGLSETYSKTNIKHYLSYIVLIFIGFFSLNIISDNTLRLFNYDFTHNKGLSLTKNTKDILRNLKRPVIAKLYYSPILEERNPEIRDVFNQIKIMLKQYRSYSRGNFDFHIYNPVYLDKNEDRAIEDGLQPIPLIDINQNALFGITFSDNITNKSVIPFFSLDKLAFLEQDLTTAIYKLSHRKKTLGVLSSLPVMGENTETGFTYKQWEIFRLIQELYDVKVVKDVKDMQQKFDVFMLIHPQNLTPEYIEEIKKQQKVLLFLDVADDASLLYSPIGGSFYSSNLYSLKDYWGIAFLDKAIVADFNNSIMVDETKEYSKNPTFTQDLLQFKVTRNELNPNHRITYKLDNVLFSTASMVSLLKGVDVSYFPLIKTSSKSGLVDADLAKKKKSPREVLEKFSPSNNMTIVAAEYLSNDAKKPFDVIAVADTDILYDNFWAYKKSFLDKSYIIPLFDNANFVLNALDYLSNNDDLISLRGKKLSKRHLFVIDELRRNGTYKYKIKESDIFRAIEGAKAALKEVSVKRDFENRNQFSSDELAIIGNIRKEINTLRQQLSDIRINAYNDIQNIEIKVKFFNIYFIALLVVIIFCITQIKNITISFCNLRYCNIWNKDILKLFLIVFLLFASAIAVVIFDNKDIVSNYEGKIILKDLNNKLNSIDKIKIQKGNNDLLFVKKDNKWVLENNIDLPVYQERIRKFLIALSNMVYYEKKSDRIDDMKFFGLSSNKDENTPTTNIVLYDKDGNEIEYIDVGWYNIDLGRGTKGAYIRLKDQFQVWLAEIDFYDLSINYKGWTYSSLWNLRFGRFLNYNNITEDNKVMNVVKNLINIYVVNVVENIDAENIGHLSILTENDDAVKLTFYKENDDKYFAKYDFTNEPKNEHLIEFYKSINGKFLEINKNDLESIINELSK